VKIVGLSVKGGNLAPALQEKFFMKVKAVLMTGGSKSIAAARVLSEAGSDALDMIKQRGGDILDVLSWAGSIALNDQGTYCRSRSGLNVLTRMRASVEHIHSNAVEPKAILRLMAEKNRSDLATCRPILEKRTQHG
jgi:NAD(P)-dependent dehydrogenase (short-subunit alcohol dehydrogenase family)